MDPRYLCSGGGESQTCDPAIKAKNFHLSRPLHIGYYYVGPCRDDTPSSCDILLVLKQHKSRETPRDESCK